MARPGEIGYAGLKSHPTLIVVLHAAGPRVEEPAIGITPLLFFPVPYEEMRLKE